MCGSDKNGCLLVTYASNKWSSSNGSMIIIRVISFLLKCGSNKMNHHLMRLRFK